HEFSDAQALWLNQMFVEELSQVFHSLIIPDCAPGEQKNAGHSAVSGGSGLVLARRPQNEKRVIVARRVSIRNTLCSSDIKITLREGYISVNSMRDAFSRRSAIAETPGATF